MRTALRDIHETDRYLLGHMSAGEKLVFQARMIASEELRQLVKAQKKTHRLVLLSGREQLRRQLNGLHRQLMQEEDFRQEVLSLFKS